LDAAHQQKDAYFWDFREIISVEAEILSVEADISSSAPLSENRKRGSGEFLESQYPFDASGRCYATLRVIPSLPNRIWLLYLDATPAGRVRPMNAVR
jgi:hypothetical protein